MSDTQPNNKKGSENYKKCSTSDGKIAKSCSTFRKNKPNLSEHKSGAKHFSTGIYEISPACRAKKQTQYKANSNPIFGLAKFALSSFMTSEYVKLGTMLGKKTKPIQSQIKPNFERLSTVLTIMCLTDILASLRFLCGQIVKIGKRII